MGPCPSSPFSPRPHQKKNNFAEKWGKTGKKRSQRRPCIDTWRKEEPEKTLKAAFVPGYLIPVRAEGENSGLPDPYLGKRQMPGRLSLFQTGEKTPPVHFLLPSP